MIRSYFGVLACAALFFGTFAWYDAPEIALELGKAAGILFLLILALSIPDAIKYTVKYIRERTKPKIVPKPKPIPDAWSPRYMPHRDYTMLQIRRRQRERERYRRGVRGV